MKLIKFPIQLNNYIEEDELIYGNELIKRYILFFIPFFCVSILEDCILNNLIFLMFYVPLKRYSGGIHFNNKDTFNKLGYKAKINTHTTSYIN